MNPRHSLLSALLGLAASSSVMADSLCEVDYTIQNSWSSGATHRLALTYQGPAVNGWTLGWRFPGDEEIVSIYNATSTQDGATVTVRNVGWNSRIRRGSRLELGFNVSQPSDGVPDGFTINGQACSNDTSDPVEPSDPPPVVTSGNWTLDATRSYLNFLSTKKVDVVEVHRFDTLSGSVNGKGEASLVIELASANTGVAIRDQRLDDILFEVAEFPRAVVSVALGEAFTTVQALQAGAHVELELDVRLELHGQSRDLPATLRIQRLNDRRFLVQSVSPIIIQANDFDLGAGMDALKQIANLSAISTAVPVDFALFFDAK